MSNLMLGLFVDSVDAGKAISELKEKGYTKDISVLSQKMNQLDPNLSEVKQDLSDGMTAGAVAGALAGVLVGVSSVIVPGLGIVYGPLAALLGVTGGAATGAVAGGLIGALVDLGLSETTAQLYDERIKRGEVLVAVSTEPNTSDEVKSVYIKYNAVDVTELDRDM